MDEIHYDGPVVLAILDGVGMSERREGNAVAQARTPFLGEVASKYPCMALEASGEAVGLSAGQMGNSEVGHNTLGAGRAFVQGVLRVEQAFETGEIFESEAWRGAISWVLKGDKTYHGIDKKAEVWYNERIDLEDAIRRAEVAAGTLHFAGIFSDGGVHSHIGQLEKMVERAYVQGVRRMRVHAIFDGRDVAPQSEPKYVRRFMEFAKKLEGADIRIASGGGRMVTVADRYENDWGMVERGFRMMVQGEAEYQFASAEEGILALRRQNPGLQDQDLPAFVVVENGGEPVGRIRAGDSLIYFDFRADRAVEIATTFTAQKFKHFDRGDFDPKNIYFAGMTEYNSDTHLPEHQLVPPVRITQTLEQFLWEHGVAQLAVSETAKFGHITYYFNGNSYEKAAGEEFIEVKSDTRPFETRPWMKSAEIADAVIDNMARFGFVRVNFPGGDMVGHTADLEATTLAIEAIDLGLKRIAAKVDELGGVMIITADHGNAEELVDAAGNPKTAHTTNKVPLMIYDNTDNAGKYRLVDFEGAGLANVAAMVAGVLGVEGVPDEWGRSLMEAA